jgi:hypothetical protein
MHTARVIGGRQLCALILVVGHVVLATDRAHADEGGDARAIVHAWDPAPDADGGADPLARALATIRARGVAVVDARPATAGPVPLAAPLAAAIALYEELRFDEAVGQLADLARSLDAWGGGELTAEQLFEAHLYRGLAQAQVGGEAAAWDAFVAAATVAPSRALDPERFSPRVLERFERARAAVGALGAATLEVTVPAGCTIWLDGAARSERVFEVAVGPHWVRGECADRPAAGQRVEVPRGGAKVAMRARAPSAPSDATILAAGARVGAATVVAIAVEGGLAVVRRLDAARGEVARRLIDLSPALADAALADAAVALAGPARPTPRTAPWKVAAWIAIGAGVATAIALPFVLRGDPTSSVTIRPTGLPTW